MVANQENNRTSLRRLAEGRRSAISLYGTAFLSALGLLAGMGALLITVFSPALPTWMYSAVWVAFLAALLALLMALARERYQLVGLQDLTAKDLHEVSFFLSSELYGFGYESLRITGAIRRDGSMSIRRHTVVKAYSTQVHKIDQWLLAPEAEPGEVTVELGVVEVDQPPLTGVERKVLRQTWDRLFLVVEIDPPITTGQQLEYVSEEKVPPGSMALTRDELVSRDLNYEFIAWDITRPTKSFKLVATFPDDLIPATIEHDVWYGVTRMRHQIERKRVASYWSERQTQSGREYSFEIPYPVSGLTYVIRWIPPDSIKAPANE